MAQDDWERWNREVPEEREQRGRVLFWAIAHSVFTAAAVPFVVLAIYKVSGGETGYVIMLTVFSLIALLTGYQAWNYIRDLKADLVTHEGDIIRKWQKGNVMLYFVPSFYVYVSHKVFAIPRDDYAMLLEEEPPGIGTSPRKGDLVRVTCYPHSLTVVRVERYDEREERFVAPRYGIDD